MRTISTLVCTLLIFLFLNPYLGAQVEKKSVEEDFLAVLSYTEQSDSKILISEFQSLVKRYFPQGSVEEKIKVCDKLSFMFEEFSRSYGSSCFRDQLLAIFYSQRELKELCSSLHEKKADYSWREIQKNNGELSEFLQLSLIYPYTDTAAKVKLFLARQAFDRGEYRNAKVFFEDVARDKFSLLGNAEENLALMAISFVYAGFDKEGRELLKSVPQSAVKNTLETTYLSESRIKSIPGLDLKGESEKFQNILQSYEDNYSNLKYLRLKHAVYTNKNGMCAMYPKNEAAPKLQLALGGWHSCLLTPDKKVKCWGAGDKSMMGGESYLQSTPPEDLKDVKFIAAGSEHTCAVLEDSTVRCWGRGGNAHPDNLDKGAALPPKDLKGVKEVALGGSHTCALLEDKTVRCWGKGDGTKLGTKSRRQSIPPKDLKNVRQLALGEDHSCALLDDKTVRCWADQEDVYGDIKYRGQASVPAGLKDVKQIASGQFFTCALQEDGKVICWGLGDATTLGGNGFGQALVPNNLKKVKHISLGASNACALQEDGMIRCWGMTDGSELGANHDIDFVLRPPSDLKNVQHFVHGGFHACALQEDMKIRCWGAGANEDVIDEYRYFDHLGQARPLVISPFFQMLMDCQYRQRQCE